MLFRVGYFGKGTAIAGIGTLLRLRHVRCWFMCIHSCACLRVACYRRTHHNTLPCLSAGDLTTNLLLLTLSLPRSC